MQNIKSLQKATECGAVMEVKKLRRLFLFLVALTVLLSGCAKQAEQKVLYTLDGSSSYQMLLSNILTDYEVRPFPKEPLSCFQEGFVCELFDVQARSLVEKDAAAHWYPQYLATIVMAVDRDKTDEVLLTWSDLLNTEQPVSYLQTMGVRADGHMLLAAMSYGLDNDYMGPEAIGLLSQLQKRNQLKVDDDSGAILICLDSHAAALAKQGRNLEIIVPAEGTLTFEKGLLSKDEIFVSENAETLLMHAGLRLIDGRSHEAIYPDENAYTKAVRVADVTQFAQETNKYSTVLRRDILKTFRFRSADGIEHNMVVLFVVVLIVLFMGFAMRKILDIYIRKVFFISGLLLIGWMFLRYIKYMISLGVFDRALWYGYYIFLLGLPLSMLWLAWSLDNPKTHHSSSTWLKRGMVLLYCLLVLCVFTNDLHNQVFVLDLQNPNWSNEYSYDWLYYIVIGTAFAFVLASIVLLIKKAWRSVKWKGIFFPLLFYLIVVVYEIFFIIGHSLARDTDLTVTVVLLFLLYYATIMMTGLIPLNKKYKELFSHSPLKMQIVSEGGEPLLVSVASEPPKEDVWQKILAQPGSPVEKNNHTLLYTDPVPGGYVVWEENIAELQLLYSQSQELGKRIKTANALLAKEKDIKAEAARREQKLRLEGLLEEQISVKLQEATELIRALPEKKNKKWETGRIAMLLCYIKRRCILLFKERASEETPAEDVLFYLKELSEFAEHVGIGLLLFGDGEEMVTSRQATLLHDFLFEVLYSRTQGGRANIVAQLLFEEKCIRFKLLLSITFVQKDFIPRALKETIEKEGGRISVKELDDTASVELVFVRGGAALD